MDKEKKTKKEKLEEKSQVATMDLENQEKTMENDAEGTDMNEKVEKEKY